MTTYTTTFDTQLGGTNEPIIATFEYNQDFTGDGLNDIRVTLELAPSANSGTEDLIGVAFDVGTDSVSGLTITQIMQYEFSPTQSLSTYTPTYVRGANQVSDGGPLDPGFNTSGNTAEPYDIGIKFSELGSGEGIVQKASFVISGSTSIDASTFLSNTDWYIRLQSTDGGQSAKMGGVIGTLPTTGSISVEKYADLNGDGDLGDDGEDVKLGAGWTFGVDINGDGDYDDDGEKQTTDETGTVTFTGLTIGQKYTVVELLSDSTADDEGNGWYNTVGTSGIEVTVASSGSTAKFGNTEYGSLVVEKYADLNGDGDLGDEGEDVKLGAGWTFGVDINGDGDYLDAGEKQTTDNTGTVTFTGLTIGQSYEVVELLGESTADDVGNGWYNTVGSDGIDVSVTTSGGSATAKFGNAEYGSLTVEKYKDLNSDGDLDDSGENVLFAGFTFKLIDVTDGNQVVATIADAASGTNADGAADGKVTFSSLIVGHEYKVEEVLPSGSPYAVTYSNNTTFTIESSGEDETAIFGNGRFEGLTPGYWKNLGYSSGDWGNQQTGYTPYGANTLFEAVFGDIGSFKSGSKTINGDNLTFLQALNLEGGGKAALARHAVAAVLNSIEEDLNYFYTQSEVITIVKDALGTIASPNNYVGDAGIELAKNHLAQQNELELFI